MSKFVSWTRIGAVSISVFLLAALLSGCLYPNERRVENQVAAGEYITVVQSAIDRYHEKTSVLPIKNSQMDTPIYEKYIIDFQKLTEGGYLSQIPANAYEKGGTSFYVLINVEKQPEVKLMDLLSAQKVVDVQKLVNRFKREHSNEIPKGEAAAPHWYALDFDQLKEDQIQVKSVYSGHYLPLLIHDTGKVVIDYGTDIASLLKDKMITNVDPQVDLRSYLVDNSYFVPAKSSPYYWVNGEPQISETPL